MTEQKATPRYKTKRSRPALAYQRKHKERLLDVGTQVLDSFKQTGEQACEPVNAVILIPSMCVAFEVPKGKVKPKGWRGRKPVIKRRFNMCLLEIAGQGTCWGVVFRPLFSVDLDLCKGDTVSTTFAAEPITLPSGEKAVLLKGPALPARQRSPRKKRSVSVNPAAASEEPAATADLSSQEQPVFAAMQGAEPANQGGVLPESERVTELCGS